MRQRDGSPRWRPARRRLGTMLALLGLTLALAAPAGAQQEAPLRLAYVNWSSAEASANVVKAVLEERLGLRCNLIETDAPGMWAAVASGEADAMLSAWLPTTHQGYLDQHGDNVADLGPNLEGARIGLVVPDVSVGRQTGGRGSRPRQTIPVQSIADLADNAARFNHRIIGIDPGAGVMQRAREALDAYDLDGMRLQAGDEDTMTAALASAIQRQEWIVVTGWQPHWVFGRWNLRFLEDPKGVFGGSERIHTMARPGLETERPRAYAVLDAFQWSPDDMEQLLVWNRQPNSYPYDNALRWVRANPAKVEAWLP